MTSHKQGFIALFFTLGISSILMAYVAVSSESVFTYFHTKESFMEIRSGIRDDYECADRYVNILIQTYALPHSFTECEILSPVLSRQSSDTLQFSFKINETEFKGTIFRGLISELKTFNNSL